MRTTVYLHPQRTVVATWDDSDAAPTLVGYAERGANDVITDLVPPDQSIAVAIHGGSTIFHGYPFDDDEDVDVRRRFELETCLPDVDDNADLVRPFESSGLVHGTRWAGLMVIPATYVAAAHRRCGPTAQVMSDLELDIRCAQHTIPQQAEPWLMIGRRGSTWQRVLLAQDGSLLHVSVVPADVAPDPASFVSESVIDARAGTGAPVRKVLLFGDLLTKATFNAVTSSVKDLGVASGRLQPFRAVRSRLDAQQATSVLAKAHLLGPLVGPVLRSVAIEAA
jgi:hypothetical protein